MRRQDTSGRAHDLVLYGATGFAGALTAEYLARHAPADCRWALAGRNTEKLGRLRDRLAAIDPACADLPLLRADSADAESLRALAEDTRVLATTVGPYLLHGEPLVAACAEAGTDYVDLTGEPEFIDRMFLRYDAKARASGARLVHACGFDSVPPDLGVHFTVGLLPSDVPLRIDGFVRTNATFSGGTLASALTVASRPVAMARAARERQSGRAGTGRAYGAGAVRAARQERGGEGVGSAVADPRSAGRRPLGRSARPLTARTSATATSRGCGGCRSRSAGRWGPGRCP